MKTVVIAISADQFQPEKITELLHAAKFLGGLSVQLIGFDEVIQAPAASGVATLPETLPSACPPVPDLLQSGGSGLRFEPLSQAYLEELFQRILAYGESA